MTSKIEKIIMLLKWNRSIELPSQLEWKNKEETELLGWEIEARPYNTKIANLFFFFMVLVVLAALYFLSSDFKNYPFFIRLIIDILFASLVLGAVAGMTHQKKKFAYRATRNGIEVCEWKDFPKVALTLLKWVAIFTAIILFAIALVEPKALFAAIIGPGGMGLIYLSMAHSKKFQEMHTSYHAACYDWSEFNKVYIDRSRHVIGLEYLWFSPYLEREIPWIFYVFCKKNDFKKNLAIIKSHVGDIPYSEEKIDIIQSG